MKSNQLITIVVPTLNRSMELKELLSSILNLNFKNFEVLVIDQNRDGLIDALIDSFVNLMPIKQFKVDFTGLSKAKNFGISKANGSYICFPDDDSKFFPETINIALSTILDSKCDIVFGKCVDEFGKDSVIKFFSDKSYLNLSNFDGKFIEATMFAKKEVFVDFKYDENLGAGSFFGAEEGYDFVYRILKYSENKLFFNPEIQIYHPQVISADYSSIEMLKRVFTYRAGFGKMCKKNKLWSKYFLRVLLVVCGVLVYLVIDKRRSRYYTCELLGLFSGVFLK